MKELEAFAARGPLRHWGWLYNAAARRHLWPVCGLAAGLMRAELRVYRWHRGL